MFNVILNIGTNNSISNELREQIRITNLVIVILIILALLLLFPFVYEDGWSISANITIYSILFFSSLFLFNHFGFYKTSRVIAVIYPSLITMVATLFIKHSNPQNVVVFDFIDSRIIMISFLLLSFMLFSLKEKALLFSTVAFSYVLIIAFDPIHIFFGVGYSRFFGSMPKEYIATSLFIDYAMLFLTGTFYYFKFNIENILQKNISLSSDLGEKNIELSALFEEVEQANAKLTNQVEVKAAELKQSNEELVKHNNELQQFSNTLSHNLRAPVANLLGLAQLFKVDKSEESRAQVADHIFKSATTLDDVIKDLNKVVDLRNNLHQIKEKIDIKKEIKDIWFVLDQNVKQCNGTLILDIKMPILYGIRSYFNSVLYNIISNAIKYRNPSRDCIVRISATEINDKCLIVAIDNGIGIDLEKYGDKLFGMYKRFHDHIEGKGLGLFLTKQQVEAMGGKISVESKLNTGTQFTVELLSLPLSQIKSQLFYESEIANIYLDAVNNITTLDWLIMPTEEEVKEVFANNIDVFNSYQSEKWILDFSKLSNISKQEMDWILEDAVAQYANIGMRKTVVVRNLENERSAFWKAFSDAIKARSIDIAFSDTIQEAKEILLKV